MARPLTLKAGAGRDVGRAADRQKFREDVPTRACRPCDYARICCVLGGTANAMRPLLSRIELAVIVRIQGAYDSAQLITYKIIKLVLVGIKIQRHEPLGLFGSDPFGEKS